MKPYHGLLIVLASILVGATMAFRWSVPHPDHSQAQESSDQQENAVSRRWYQLGRVATTMLPPQSSCGDSDQMACPIAITFAPSPAPANVTPSVAVTGVPDDEVISDDRCGGQEDCLLLMNKADIGKDCSQQVCEQYILTPVDGGGTSDDSTQWAATLDQRDDASATTVDFILLGAQHKDPEHPLASASFHYAPAPMPTP